MLYAIAAICVCLTVLALLGKPIRVEIIHTVTPAALPPEEVARQAEDIKNRQQALDAMKYLNETFHNVKGEEVNGGESK